jgi:hypothetical protein
MRNLLALLALALLVFAGVGWMLGWYNIQSTSDSSGHRQIHIDVNTPKITQDLNKGREKLRDILSQDTDPGSHATVTPTAPQGSAGLPQYWTTEDGTFIYGGSEESSPPSLPPVGGPRLVPKQ